MREDPAQKERNRADALILSGCYAEAIPIYRWLAETFPEEESHLLALAWALHDGGCLEEAVACFERLFEREVARKVFTGFAYDELVRIYRARQDWRALVLLCERAAAAQSDDAGLQQTLGEAYLSAGKTGEALQVFEALAHLEPESPENWCALGIARLATGDPGGAESACLRAAEIEPADAPAFFDRLAEGCLRYDHPERAKAALDHGLALDPGQPARWMTLAEALVRLERTAEAAEACEKAGSLNPATAGNCWHHLGNLLTKEGFHPQAAESFARAALAEPDNPRYLLRLAASYTAQGRIESAADVLRRAEALIGHS